jgi:hypothetical protein
MIAHGNDLRSKSQSLNVSLFKLNVVNEILTFSASCSDNFKGYLHSKVVSKQVEINEMARHDNKHDNDNKKNSNGNDDVDEDGFVVIKMRKPRPKNARNINDETSANTLASIDNVKTIKESNIIKEIIEELIIEVAGLY